ncbi:MAG: 5-formyltetrahydrofolate cyclo-ligase [Phycisphaerae bacterium]|nr:5-formyltetrahydrofolate cyclo-ligase [Phycisphaerae bacterium]
MKQTIRNQIRAILRQMPHDAAAAKSLAVARRVWRLKAFRSARTVMLYLPVLGEVDVLPIARAAWRNGKKVLAPTACDHCRTMRAILCCPVNEEMFHPHHGLRQPNRDLGELTVDQLDLVIVPAVAFDPKGNRLGRGGGFYDRFLARPELRAETLGVAYAEQIVPSLPVHANDRPVNIVVTDKKTYKAG